MGSFDHFLRWTIGLAKATSGTSELERDCLARHAADKRVVAEVGVWHGLTTCRLLKAMNRDGRLFAIDPYQPGRLGVSFARIIAEREIRPHALGRVHWLRMTGVAAAKSLSKELDQIDFLFLDGDHSYEGLRDDWEAWAPALRPGATMALHDSRSTPERPIDEAGSVRFTREVVIVSPHFEVIDELESLTILRKRSIGEAIRTDIFA
jgi:predicted O-methyltransferase YrrM